MSVLATCFSAKQASTAPARCASATLPIYGTPPPHLTSIHNTHRLRSAIRVLLLVADDDLHGANDVYEFVRAAADWPTLIPPECTFSVDTRVHDCPGVTSAQYVQTRTKDAICDALRDAR